MSADTEKLKARAKEQKDAIEARTTEELSRLKARADEKQA